MNNPLLELLEMKVKSHDWYYQYSDDHRMWVRGKDQRHVIDNMMKDLFAAGLEAEAIEVYNANCPEDYRIKS
jgi:tryptophanyl-tRNA synthetase